MPIHQPLTFREQIYRIYRKIRFLAKRGTLFSNRTRYFFHGEDYVKGTFTTIFLHSTFLFLLAYLLISVITQIATCISAQAFDINTILYYYDINFLITGDKWTPDAVHAIFSTGPIIALLIGILLFLLYMSVITESGILRLLVLWMFAQTIVHFLGNMLMGALFRKGFGYVIMYMFFMDTGKMLISVFALVVMVSLGIFLPRLFLFSGNIYFNYLNGKNRRKFIWAQFIYPFLAGNIILLLLKIPEITLFEVCTNATMLFVLLPVALLGMKSQDLFFDEDPRTMKLSIPLIVITVLALLLYRIIFGFGIRL